MEKEKTSDNCKEFVVVGVMIEKQSVPNSDIEESIMILGDLKSPLNFMEIFRKVLSDEGLNRNY